MKKTIIITILFSLLSAISTYLLFNSMEGFKTEIRESKNVVKELKVQVSNIEENYKNQIQYWVVKNNALVNQIQNTEVALTQSTQKVNFLQGKIQLLISESKILKDTSDIITNCDSLKTQVMQFISETNMRDSLCDNEIADLKCVIQNKDSLVAVCENSFSMLRQVADSSLAQQSELTEKLKLADKKIHRSNLKTKILSAGILILSGATATLLLQK
ncbi:MAG: hypothetical protein HY841_00865 [Bacteroidetes bacterium]|nr:hypothetical protein [Bacteroidota bacterium]